MKTEKLSLKSIKNVLSRGEMRKIMAGSGPVMCPEGRQCWGDGYCPNCACITIPDGGGYAACG